MIHGESKYIADYFTFLNSSVGERPAPRGETTRPDERKNPVS